MGKSRPASSSKSKKVVVSESAEAAAPNELETQHGEFDSQDAELTLFAYHERAASQWILGTVIISIIILTLSWFHWNIAFSLSALGIGLIVIRKEVEGIRADFAADLERKRALPKSQMTQVPPEWLNSYIQALWPILDPAIFVAGTDLLEDSLHAAAPSAVRSVRVSGVSQGTNAIRLLGIKCLPPDTDITLPSGSSLVPSTAFANIVPLIPVSSPDETDGTFFVVECEFSYRRLPPTPQSSQPPKTNPHFYLHLGLGAGRLRVEIPVYVEILGLRGKIRLRLQLIPEPPFVQHVTFTFPGIIPKIDIAAKPLRSIDIMKFPGSEFVVKAIERVCMRFVAPLSYTVDMSRFFLGSDVVTKTISTGVVVLVIHRASRLSATDKAIVDPCVLIAVGEHQSAATRSLEKDVDPSWEEIFFLRVSSDDLDNNLRLTVVDRDRFAGDEALGFHVLPMSTLQIQVGTYQHIEAKLTCSQRGVSIDGMLSFSVAFFPLAVSSPHATEESLKYDNAVEVERSTKRQRSSYAARSNGQEDGISFAYAQRMREMLDGRLPASPIQPSGIIALQIHQLSGLDSPSSTPPAVYCLVFANSEKVLQTPVKKTASPYFDSRGSSEFFCRDWTAVRLVAAVMESSRDPGEDRIIGTLEISGKTTFERTSQSTKWFALDTGHGRIRISLLFKPLDIVIAPLLRLGNVGAVELGPLRMTTSEQVLGRITLVVEGNVIATSEVSTIRHDSNDTSSRYELDWPESVSLAVVSRSTSPVVFKFAGIETLQRRRVEAEGVLWLSAVGEVSSSFQIPLLLGTFDARPYPRTSEVPLPTLPPSKHSRIPSTSHQSTRPQLTETPFGLLEFTARFVSGMSEHHSPIIADHPLSVQQAFLVARTCRAKRLPDRSAAISPLHLSTLLDSVRREGVDSSRSSFEVGSGGAQWDVIQGELNALAEVRSASPASKKLGGIKSFMSRASGRSGRSTPKKTAA